MKVTGYWPKGDLGQELSDFKRETLFSTRLYKTDIDPSKYICEIRWRVFFRDKKKNSRTEKFKRTNVIKHDFVGHQLLAIGEGKTMREAWLKAREMLGDTSPKTIRRLHYGR